MEYMLTNDKPVIASSLKNRLKVGMPVRVFGEKYTVVGKVSKPLKNAHVIIHEAAEVCGKIRGQVESMNYCLTFLNKHANTMKEKTRMWVTGDVMIELMTHTNKKIKWVFDETIIHKVGCVGRSSTSTLSQESQG